MRYPAVWLILCFCCCSAWAQEVTSPKQTAKIDIFGMPTAVVREITADNSQVSVTAPEISCKDASLLEQILAKLSAEQIVSPEENIVERRHRKLALKHLGNFKDAAVKDFAPSENYRVADRLIEVKINERLGDEALKLCVGDNPVLERKIYLLLYNTDSGTKVEIINYLNDSDKEETSFIYQIK